MQNAVEWSNGGNRLNGMSCVSSAPKRLDELNLIVVVHGSQKIQHSGLVDSDALSNVGGHSRDDT